MIKFNANKLIGHKIRIIHTLSDKVFDGILNSEENKIPRGQGMMIGYLCSHTMENVYQKDLEEAFSISRATASTMLKSLENNGYIQRIPVKEDGRLKKIVVTERAVEHEKKVRGTIDHIEDIMTNNFTKEEIKQFDQYLDRIISNLEK